MAKWGEGDPRWIVEERPDATNVNNWHWTEKNATPWSQEKIKELFLGLEIPSAIADITVEGVDKCEGEASASNRKGKLIFFYEWDLILKWSGSMKGNTPAANTGTITIPNLSEENDLSDIDIQVTLQDPSEEGQLCKDIIYQTGRDLIRTRLSDYINGLKVEFSKGMILPKKDGEQATVDHINNLTSGFNKKISMVPIVSDAKNIGVKLDVGTVNITQKFQCKAQEFYDAMTRVEMVTAFTRGAVKLDPVKGGKFELFGGNIIGTFKELVPGKKIVQHWRYKQWPTGHMSIVTINIEEKSDHTEIQLVQTGVPNSEITVTKENWDRYYWESMKRAFGFGSFFT